MKKVISIFVLTLSVFMAQGVYAATMAWDKTLSSTAVVVDNDNSNVEIDAHRAYDAAAAAASASSVVDFVFKTDALSTISSVAIEFLDKQIDIASVTLLGTPSTAFTFSTTTFLGKTLGVWSLANTTISQGSHTIRLEINSAKEGAQVDVKVNAVPVPAAVWLFGSALMGLVGVSRRKASANGLAA